MTPTDRVFVTIKIESCMDCHNHIVDRDPDPHDSFNSDDEAVLCRLCPNTEHKMHYAQALGEFAFKPITLSCRPYMKRKETNIPEWCPLLPPSNKQNGANI